MPNPVPQGYNVFFDIIQLLQDEGIDLPFQPTINFIGAGVTAADDAGNNRTNVTIPGAVQTPHDLLDGVINQDTVANTPTQGSLIKGNGTPAWDEFILGTALQQIRVNAGATDLEYFTPASIFYQTVQDEGVGLAQEPILDFVGAGVTASAGAGKTIVTIPGGGGGGWDHLLSFSPASDTDLITLTFASRQFVTIYAYLHGVGTINVRATINGNEGSNYAWYRQQNAGGWASSTSQTSIQLDPGSVSHSEFVVMELSNTTKLGTTQITHFFTRTTLTDDASAGSTPERQQADGIFAVAGEITSVEFRTSEGDFDASETFIVVFGKD